MKNLLLSLYIVSLLLSPPLFALSPQKAAQMATILEQCPIALGVQKQNLEEPREISAEELDKLWSSLAVVPFGRSVAQLLAHYHQFGLDPKGEKKLKFIVKSDLASPATAEFNETGEIHFKQSFIQALTDPNTQIKDEFIKNLSFAVHEAVHAISYANYLRGLFPVYDSGTKVNEALAYYAQGFFIRQLTQRGFSFFEQAKIPLWDRCTNVMIQVVQALDITPSMDYHIAIDILSEFELENENEHLDSGFFVRLQGFYDFIYMNPELWQLQDKGFPEMRAVTDITTQLIVDVEFGRCEMEYTLKLMSTRIPLYARLRDKPDDIKACDYFVQFAQSLQRSLPGNDPSQGDISKWFSQQSSRQFNRFVQEQRNRFENGDNI